jgi:hypothetical protein
MGEKYCEVNVIFFLDYMINLENSVIGHEVFVIVAFIQTFAVPTIELLISEDESGASVQNQ